MSRASALTKRVGWATVAFGDVVQLSKERSSDPEADGYERYIGLEHIDPGELRVTRWGKVSDGVTFTSVFHPGQVLFGKRRAYQRKVAVVDFSGVCSSDIYVLAPRGDALLPGLLPFICQSDAFFEHAVGTSAGSLSPRTNWKSLASFKFALPPREEQRRLASMLGGAQKLLEANHKLVASIARAGDAYLGSIVARVLSEEASIPLGDLADVRYGLTVNQERRKASPTCPYLRVANVGRGFLDLEEVKHIGRLEGDEVHELHHGDVLLVEGHANREEIGRASMWAGEIPGAMHQNHLIRARCGPRLKPEYLVAMVNSLHGQSYFRSRAKSSSGLNTINSTVVKAFSVPCPSRDTQDRISLLRVAIQQAARVAHERSRWVRSMILTAGLCSAEVSE